MSLLCLHTPIRNVMWGGESSSPLALLQELTLGANGGEDETSKLATDGDYGSDADG